MDSVIYELSADGILTAMLEETDQYMITKRFLNDKERMLEESFAD